MKKLSVIIFACILAALAAPPVMAADVPDLAGFTSNSMQIITLISTASAVFFLIVGGYTYITSTGRPESIISAKKTITGALIGLILVLSAQIFISLLKDALPEVSSDTSASVIEMQPVTTETPSEGLTQVLIDAVSGFMRNIAESSTKPVVDGVMSFLLSTPSVLENSVVFNFWLVSVGIVDTLFVIVVALLGLQMMSASTFGFEEVTLKQILPKIGLAFIAANTSLFLADYIILTCNVLVQTVLNATGGLHQTWITDISNPVAILTGTPPLITLIFLIIFLMVSIVLLLMYVSRLIVIALGAALAPFICLLWLMPKFSDFAEIATKTYIVTVFSVFVHVVIIQLASAFLSLPEHSENSLISIAVAIGLFVTLLKTPSVMMQFVMYTSSNGTMKKLGNQMINVISSEKSSNLSDSSSGSQSKPRTIKAPRKAITA
jgi:hypothetical protein